MTDDLDDLDYRPSAAKRYAPLGVLAVAGLGLGIWAWPYVTGWQRYPDRWSEAVSAGVDLNAVQLTGERAQDYAYSFSPLSRQLEAERRWLEVDTEAIEAFGDRIAEVEPTEPAIRKVLMHLVAEPTLRSDAEAVPDDQHAAHQFRIDRRSTSRAVVRRQEPTDVG